MPETTSCRIDIHCQGVEATSSLTELIREQLRSVLSGLECQVVHAHVRLYAARGGCTCYMRVDLFPCGCVARGDSGEDACQAVVRASARLRAAASEHGGSGSIVPRRR